MNYKQQYKFKFGSRYNHLKICSRRHYHYIRQDTILSSPEPGSYFLGMRFKIPRIYTNESINP